jgi:hypothetical protein
MPGEWKNVPSWRPNNRFLCLTTIWRYTYIVVFEIFRYTWLYICTPFRLLDSENLLCLFKICVCMHSSTVFAPIFLYIIVFFWRDVLHKLEKKASLEAVKRRVHIYIAYKWNCWGLYSSLVLKWNFYIWSPVVLSSFNSIQLFQLRLSTSKAEKSNTSTKGCWESLYESSLIC